MPRKAKAMPDTFSVIRLAHSHLSLCDFFKIKFQVAKNSYPVIIKEKNMISKLIMR